MDLSGDGHIGHRVETIEADGIGLKVSTQTGYLIADGADEFVVTNQGDIAGPDSYDGWQALAAGSNGAGGYSLLWEHSSGVYGVWDLDATGALVAFPDVSNLIDFEDRFAVDLSGDLLIG